MWNAIIRTYAPNGNKSVILTSHSMEEVEALSTKLAIMAKGQIRCIGTIQHLNNKYGSGYVLEIKWKSGSDLDFDKIQSLVRDLFPDMVVIQNLNNRAKMSVPQSNIKSFAKIFKKFDKWKHDYPDIQELGMSQSSIENVFLGFAN